MASLRILVVDDDEIWRRGLERLVEDRAGWEIAGEALHATDAIRLASETSADVVVIGGAFASETIEEIKARRPDARIVLFGAHLDSDVLRDALKVGVLALLSKSDPVETVRQALEAVSHDEMFLSPGASELVVERYLSATAWRVGDRTPTETLTLTLTTRERDIVRLLAEGKTNRAVAAQLGISVKTVENHRANAMRKLGARSVADLVRAAIRAGFIEG